MQSSLPTGVEKLKLSVKRGQEYVIFVKTTVPAWIRLQKRTSFLLKTRYILQDREQPSTGLGLVLCRSSRRNTREISVEVLPDRDQLSFLFLLHNPFPKYPAVAISLLSNIQRMESASNLCGIRPCYKISGPAVKI